MGPIFKIIAFTRRFSGWYLFMGVFVVVVSLLNLVGPLLGKQIVDKIVAQLSGTAVTLESYIPLLALIIATDVTITILTTFSQWIGDILTVRLQTYLATAFYKHVLSLHVGYFDNEITGRIVNKLYRGIESITNFIQSMLNNFLPFFLTAFATIILLAHYSLFIAVLLAVLFPIYILISHGSTLAWGRFEGQKNTISDTSQGRVFESIAGIRVVKAFAADVKELATFVKHREKIESLTISQTKGWHIYDFARRLVLNIILFAIYAYIVFQTFQRRYTIGEMTLLLALVQQARFPLFAMSFILGQIQQANSGSADFFKILETKSLIEDTLGAGSLRIPKILNPKQPLIEFKNVSFTYDSNNPVLYNVNANIYPKEKLALVGESGQGKSTLVNILLRYYEPQEGTITISGENIATVSQDSLRNNIAVVFQESLLFSGTIFENIAYGRPKATHEEVIGASKAANAHEFIQKLPQKYHSLIGERGVKLSGGQKQRIAIARAILKNAPIIILDEATSSLDSKAELEVQKGLARLLAGRTAIIIAHRLSTVSGADHILVIANGTVAQYGTPKQLLTEKRGLYARMVDLQRELLSAPSVERAKKLQEFDLVA